MAGDRPVVLRTVSKVDSLVAPTIEGLVQHRNSSIMNENDTGRRLLVAGSVQLESGKGADGACKWDPIACQRASVDMRQGSPAAGLVRVPQWLGPVGLRVAN